MLLAHAGNASMSVRVKRNRGRHRSFIGINPSGALSVCTLIPAIWRSIPIRRELIVVAGSTPSVAHTIAAWIVTVVASMKSRSATRRGSNRCALHRGCDRADAATGDTRQRRHRERSPRCFWPTLRYLSQRFGLDLGVDRGGRQIWWRSTWLTSMIADPSRNNSEANV